MKSVENNPKSVKAKVENRLKDGVRAAEASSVRVETRTRVIRDPPKSRTRGDWDTWWA